MQALTDNAVQNFMNGLDPKKMVKCFTVTFGLNNMLKIYDGIKHNFRQSGSNPQEGYECVSIGQQYVPVTLGEGTTRIPDIIHWARISRNERYNTFSLVYNQEVPHELRDEELILIHFRLSPLHLPKNKRACYTKITGDRKFVNRLGFKDFPGCMFISQRIGDDLRMAQNNKESSGVEALALVRRDEIVRISADHNVYHVGPFHNDTISIANAKMHIKLNGNTSVDNWQVRDLKENQIEMPLGFNASTSNDDTDDPNSGVIGEDSYFIRWLLEDGEYDVSGISFTERFYESETYGFTPLSVYEG